MERKARVCVADDDKQVCSVLARELRLHAYDTIEAYSGREALNACGDGNVDLVLLDINMPDLDGFEVCEQLKQGPTTSEIPVVFVTARGEPSAIERGMELGALDYITKPYNLPMVLVRVESILAEQSLKTPVYLNHTSILDSAYTDNVTGLRNSRYFMERLQEEADRANRYDFPISVVLFDIVDWLNLDDSTHQLATEDLLAEVAMGMRNHSRTFDILSRYDDGVFAALLPHAPLSQAMLYCEKIIDEFDHTTLSEPKRPTRASLTAGAVTCQRSVVVTADAIFGEAMGTLLQSQSLPGRRVVGRELPRV